MIDMTEYMNMICILQNMYVYIYILTQPYLPQKDAKIRSNSRVWSDPQKDGELKRLTVFLFRRAISI